MNQLFYRSLLILSMVIVKMGTSAQAPLISYPDAHQFTRGTAITSISPTNTGGPATSWTVNPILPQGITINSSGQLSGIPTLVSAPRVYQISANNASGSSTAQLVLSVRETLPQISYPSGTQLLRAQTAISPISPNNTGGAVPAAAYGQVSQVASLDPSITPYSVGIDHTNQLAYVGYSGSKIERIELSTQAKTTIPYSSMVMSLMVDKAGQLYISDPYFSFYGKTIAIQRMDPSTQALTDLVAQTGFYTTMDHFGTLYGTNSGKLTKYYPAPINDIYTYTGSMRRITVNDKNEILAIVSDNSVIKIDRNGTASTLYTAASTTRPRGIAADPSGNIYLADNQTGNVTRIAPDGTGQVIASNLPSSYDLAYHRNGQLYILLQGSTKSLQKIELNGYTISPALPAGLDFDQRTGTISGTPTAASPLTTYTITAHNTGGSHSSTLDIQITEGTLPVELTTFTAKRHPQGVQLQWQTRSEKDNQHFELHRSGNGTDFEKIVQKAGKGTTNQAQNYSHIDTQPLQGNNYYRLVQVDYNGNTQVLGERVINFDLDQQTSLYPNPTSGRATIRFQAGSYQTLTLTDASGRKLQHRKIEKDRDQLELDLSKLGNGLYLVILSGNGEQTVQKIIKK